MLLGLRLLALGRDLAAETSSRRDGDQVARIPDWAGSVESTQASQRRGVPGHLGTSCHLADGDSVRRQPAESSRVARRARGAAGRARRELQAAAWTVAVPPWVVRVRGFCCAPSAQRRSCVLWRIWCSARLGVGRHSSSDRISLRLMRRFGQGVVFAALAGGPRDLGFSSAREGDWREFLGFGLPPGRFAVRFWRVAFGVA